MRELVQGERKEHWQALCMPCLKKRSATSCHFFFSPRYQWERTWGCYGFTDDPKEMARIREATKAYAEESEDKVRARERTERFEKWKEIFRGKEDMANGDSQNE